MESGTSTLPRIPERLGPGPGLPTPLRRRSPVAIPCISIRLRSTVRRTSTRLPPQGPWATRPPALSTPCTKAHQSRRMRGFTKRFKTSVPPTPPRTTERGRAAQFTMLHLLRYTWRMWAARRAVQCRAVHPEARRPRGCTPTPTRLKLDPRISTPVNYLGLSDIECHSQ